MDKDKLIQALTNLPEEWIKNAYCIDIWDFREIKIQMKYNQNIVKELTDGNRWQHEIDSNGLMVFKRDDGLGITMT